MLTGEYGLHPEASEYQTAASGVEDARAFAAGIVETVREPLVVLDSDLRVRTANRSFYRVFHVSPTETEGRSLFDLGNGQWDIPRLRELLEDILPRNAHFDDFQVDHEFEGIGRRSMVLNARRLASADGQPGQVLLAIEDATERLRAAEALALSEIRYRRLFETAQDGILIVDAASGRVFDVNPFLAELLGYSRNELVGKELWEIGLFHDVEASKSAFRELWEKGSLRYDDLPLQTKDGQHVEVEFVSNVYDVGNARVIQCNIRDIVDRKRTELALQVAHADLEVRVRQRTAELARVNVALTDEIAQRERAEREQRELRVRLASAQEDERRRIARELHDQMGQHMTALAVGLKVIKDTTADPSPVRDRLQGLQTLTDEIGREIHDIALELRPTALDDLGLQVALANYAEAWAERSGVAVDFRSAGVGEGRLPPPIETTLYRVVQEALTNVLKHAAAGRVSVVLQKSSGLASVIVEDDGRGFDPDSPAGDEQQLGILGMRERAALVGGTLTIESRSGRGTTVIARVPLSNAENSHV